MLQFIEKYDESDNQTLTRTRILSELFDRKNGE